MIQNDDELAVVRKQLERLEGILRSLKREVLPKSQAQFRIMAEGPIDEHARLRREIDEYLGIGTIADVAEGPANVTGIIRQIDLDENTFQLRERGPGLHDLLCEYDELSEASIQTLVGQRVTVSGTMRASPKTGWQRMEADTVEAQSPNARPVGLSA